MNNNPYNSAVRACFTSPDHAGEAAGGVVAFFEDQGMRIRLSADVSKSTITELRFLAWGCPHVIAAAEAVCRQFEGRAAAELEQFDSGQIMRDLAVPVEKTGRILALEDTVRSLGQAVQDRLSKQGMTWRFR
jgi:NifU-like protein involved in Fe-S cluster formation